MKYGGIDAEAELNANSVDEALTTNRMTTTERNALGLVLDGMIIYNTTVPEFQGRENGAWVSLGGAGGAGTLAQTLALGNTTGGTAGSGSILFSADDVIQSLGDGDAFTVGYSAAATAIGGGITVIAQQGGGANNGGNASFAAGDSGNGATGNAGAVGLLGGTAQSTNGNGGLAIIQGGQGSGSGASGSVFFNLDTGGATPGTFQFQNSDSTKLSVDLNAGSSVDMNVDVAAGNFTMQYSAAAVAAGSSLNFISQAAGATGAGGGINFTTGAATQANAAGGNVVFNLGNGGASGFGQGGDFRVFGGTGEGVGGEIELQGGIGTGTGAAGGIELLGGDAVSGSGGTVNLQGGTAAGGNNDGGDITAQPGVNAGTGVHGTFQLLGTGATMVIDEIADHSIAFAAGQGMLWTRNDIPNVLVFTDDVGTDFVLNDGLGGETLAQTLAIGNTTGGTAGSGSILFSADDVIQSLGDGDAFTIGYSAAATAAGGVLSITGQAGGGTGDGGAASLIGGDSGTGATGNAGAIGLLGGTAQSTNGNGGTAVVQGGQGSGSGTSGSILLNLDTGGATPGTIQFQENDTTFLTFDSTSITSVGALTVDAAGGELTLDDVGNIGITLTDASNRALIETGTDEVFNGVTSLVGALNANAGTFRTAGTAASTGLLTGGVVTVNGGNPANVDISAGTGIHVDDTDPGNPIVTLVSFGPFTNETLPDIATTLFTPLAITSAGALIKVGGLSNTPTTRRSTIRLQTVEHRDLSTVTNILEGAQPAWNLGQSLLDQALAVGPVLTGNTFAPGDADLTIGKTAGTTSLPFINFRIDSSDPNVLANAALNPHSWVTSYQDGVGGFTFGALRSTSDVANYDDGSGTLAAVSPTNNYTIKRIYFFGQANESVITYGQAVYSSLDAAEAAIFSEAPTIDPVVQVGRFRSALIVRSNATDLSDPTQARFVAIINDVSTGTSSTAWGSIVGVLSDQTDLQAALDAKATLAGEAGGQNLRGGTASGDDLTLESTSDATKGDIILAASSALLFNDMTAPANPSAGQGRLYKKTGNDGIFWKPDAAGPEVDLTTAVASNEFADNLFRIQDNSDNTKEIAFEASGITTSTTRTITVPDSDLTMLVPAGLAGGQTIVGGTASGEDLTLESTANATKGSIILATGTNLDASDEDVINAKTITFGSAPGTDASTSGVLALDFSENQKRVHVLDENVTSVTVTAPPGIGNFMVAIEQAAGLYSLPAAVASWPSSFEFIGDVAPVAPATSGQVILLGVYYDGTTYRVQASGTFNT